MSLGLAHIETRCTLSPTGMQLPDDLSFDEWVEVGRKLSLLGKAHQWWVGDWLHYGEHKWGEKYAQAMDETGWAYQTLRDAAWVSGRFELSRRRDNLSWSHHREVAALDPPEAEELLEAAERGGWTRNELRQAVKTYKRQLAVPKDEETGEPLETCSVSDLAELVMRGKRFSTIYADPPWPYQNQATRAATSNHYGVMTLEDIAALPVRELTTENAHLHLWTTNAFLFDARAIMEAWGFEYKSCFVWVKPQMGIGNYWRVSHEFLLFGVKGSLPFADRGQMSWRQWDRTRHSEKPYEMYQLIEKVSPGPYLELFARRQVEGWTSWGNEIERDLFFKAAS